MIKKSDGFTLVELIVVIVILGILTGVTIGGVYGYVNESRVSADIADARYIQTSCYAAIGTKDFYEAQRYFTKLTPSVDPSNIHNRGTHLEFCNIVWARDMTWQEALDGCNSGVGATEGYKVVRADGTEFNIVEYIMSFIDKDYTGPKSADYLIIVVGALADGNSWLPQVQVCAFKDSNKNYYFDFWEDELVSSEVMGNYMKLVSKLNKDAMGGFEMPVMPEGSRLWD